MSTHLAQDSRLKLFWNDKFILFSRFILLVVLLVLNYVIRFRCESMSLPINKPDVLLLSLQSIAMFQLFNHLFQGITMVRESDEQGVIGKLEEHIYQSFAWVIAFIGLFITSGIMSYCNHDENAKIFMIGLFTFLWLASLPIIVENYNRLLFLKAGEYS